MANTPSATSNQPQILAQQQSSAPPLPPAQTFDILPALHELLSRIDHAPRAEDEPSFDTSSPTADAHAHYADLAPLDPKDLPNEVLAVKTRIRRALRELEKLPDMNRGVEEQREEMQALEMRVAAQRAMVKRLGELAGGLKER